MYREQHDRLIGERISKRISVQINIYYWASNCFSLSVAVEYLLRHHAGTHTKSTPVHHCITNSVIIL